MRHKFKMLSIVVGIIFLVLAAHSKTEAAVKDLQVFTQTWNTVDVMVGDTGYLRPQTENLKDPLGQPVQIASWYIPVMIRRWWLWMEMDVIRRFRWDLVR